MNATKDHTSLETGKLLKWCGIECKYAYGKCLDEWSIYPHPSIDNRPNPQLYMRGFPAFTWQEILWEHSMKFFGENDHYSVTTKNLPEYGYDYIATQILVLLQKGNYDEADRYFREHCILINKDKNQ